MLHERLIPAHAGKTPPPTRSHHGAWAHPRSRGENHSQTPALSQRRGSSPLTRGKRARCRSVGGASGLIPAHAGKTSTRRGSPSPSWAHPRSRGENDLQGAQSCGYTGSSPLTRGKPFGGLLGHGQGGLIPAHAGKTHPPRDYPRRAQAHPRSRGENVADVRVARSAEWLIPAHAGKTWCLFGGVLARWAHPRSRGENRMGLATQPGEWGSSPLTRGKLRSGMTAMLPRGLIPAHAGKTGGQVPALAGFGAHPRSRGENRFQSSRGSSFRGSSPLTRGKPGSRARLLA